MKKIKKSLYCKRVRCMARIFIACITVFIIAAVSLSMTGCGAVLRWAGTGYGNTVEYVDRKIDDATNYETKKKVEDACRAMISSYESDKLTYEQYKDSDNEEKQSWAEQSKMRANKTASTYNNYILKNKFVWNDNIPEDICMELETID